MRGDPMAVCKSKAGCGDAIQSCFYVPIPKAERAVANLIHLACQTFQFFQTLFHPGTNEEHISQRRHK